ncbi:hypothetical protein DL771_009339 [Monosporascus sp. 5C6A]|nr:hypothetical protein DL771_009339 [Monosporascus sp. 5C6A]
MAVLDEVPGIEVAVQINGRNVVEYDDPDASEQARPCPTSSKYIESIDDAEFTIRYTASLDYNWEGYQDHVLRFRAFADGFKLSGKVLFKTDALYGRCIRAAGFSQYDPETKSTYKYNCKFSPVSTVDDSGHERVIQDSRVAKKLGLIEVEVYRSTYSDSRERGASSVATPHSYVLAEKSLKGKAISHGVSLRAGPARRFGTSKRMTDLSPSFGFSTGLKAGALPALLCGVHWLTKPTESLKQELIIPRSPPVPRSYVLRMTFFGEAAQLAEMEELEEMRQMIKSSRVEEESRPVKKREISEVYDLTQDQAPPRPTKLSRLASGREVHVIDLTDD